MKLFNKPQKEAVTVYNLIEIAENGQAVPLPSHTYKVARESIVFPRGTVLVPKFKKKKPIRFK